jgi:hypothetical protein
MIEASGSKMFSISSHPGSFRGRGKFRIRSFFAAIEWPFALCVAKHGG